MEKFGFAINSSFRQQIMRRQLSEPPMQRHFFFTKTPLRYFLVLLALKTPDRQLFYLPTRQDFRYFLICLVSLLFQEIATPGHDTFSKKKRKEAIRTLAVPALSLTLLSYASEHQFSSIWEGTGTIRRLRDPQAGLQPTDLVTNTVS